jgi:hypothetical protein
MALIILVALLVKAIAVAMRTRPCGCSRWQASVSSGVLWSAALRGL